MINTNSMFVQFNKAAVMVVLQQLEGWRSSGSGRISTVANFLSGVIFISGRIICVEENEHGTLIFISNQKADVPTFDQMGWKIVPIWISKCGAGSGVLTCWNSNTYSTDGNSEVMLRMKELETNLEREAVNCCAL